MGSFGVFQTSGKAEVVGRSAETIFPGMIETLFALSATGRYSPLALLGLLSFVFAKTTGPIGPALVFALHICGSWGLEYLRLSYAGTDRTKISVPDWARAHMWMSAITGASWALATFVWFDPDNFSSQSWLALCIMSICSGSMLSRAAHPPSMIVHVLLSGLPLCILSLWTGDAYSVGVGACGILYLTWLLNAGRVQFEQYASNCALAQENSDLVSHLTTARDAADASNRAKSEFLSVVSHELRTPLNGILGMTSILSDGDLTEPQRKAIATIRDASEALCLIIDDLLDLSRLDAGRTKLELQRVDLSRLVESVVQILRIRAWEKKLTLEINIEPSVPEFVVGDPGRLRQILINLVGNAVKFTDRGGVYIRVACALSSSDRLTFEVRDTGIGIPESALGKLFLPFSQVDQSFTRNHGGTGLGLSIVKRLAALMEGEVGVKSELGVGSTFWVKIPVALNRAHDVAESPEPQNTEVELPTSPMTRLIKFKSLRLLVIDDSVHMREMLMAVLSAAGHDVVLADSGIEGLEITQKGNIDLVLLDLEMPNMDGAATARLLRTLPGFQDGQIIALSGHDLGHVRASGLSNAADLVLTKPIRPDILLAAIADLHERLNPKARSAA